MQRMNIMPLTASSRNVSTNSCNSWIMYMIVFGHYGVCVGIWGTENRMARIHLFQVSCCCNCFCQQWRTSVIFANQNTLHIRNDSCRLFACVIFGASIMVLFWPKSLVLIDPNNDLKRVRSVLHESSLVKVTTTILDFQSARKIPCLCC